MHQTSNDASIGVLDPRGSRQMDMPACPLGSLLAGIKTAPARQHQDGKSPRRMMHIIAKNIVSSSVTGGKRPPVIFILILRLIGNIVECKDSNSWENQTGILD